MDKENGVIDMASAAKVSEALKDMKLTAGADTTITVKGVTTTATDNTLTLPETSDADLTIVLDGVKTAAAPLTVSTPALGNVTILLKDGEKDLNLNVTAPYATVTIASEGQSTIENLVVKTSSDIDKDWKKRTLTLDEGVTVNFLNILQTIAKDKDGNIEKTTIHGYVLVNEGAKVVAAVVDEDVTADRTSFGNDIYEYGINYRDDHVLHNNEAKDLYRISSVKVVKGSKDWVNVGTSYYYTENGERVYALKKVTIDSKATAEVRGYVEEIAGLINGTDTAHLRAYNCDYVKKVSNVIACHPVEATTWYNGVEVKYEDYYDSYFGGELSNVKVVGSVRFTNYAGAYNVSNVKFTKAHIVVVKGEYEYDYSRIYVGIPSKKDAGGAFTQLFSNCAFDAEYRIEDNWNGSNSRDPILDENGEQKHLIYWYYEYEDEDGNVQRVQKDSYEDFTLAERKENHIEKIDMPLYYADLTPAYDEDYVATLALTNCTLGGVNYTKSSNVWFVQSFNKEYYQWIGNEQVRTISPATVKYQINGVTCDIVNTNAGWIFN